jgi:hypothetical protein
MQELCQKTYARIRPKNPSEIGVYFRVHKVVENSRMKFCNRLQAQKTCDNFCQKNDKMRHLNLLFCKGNRDIGYNMRLETLKIAQKSKGKNRMINIFR